MEHRYTRKRELTYLLFFLNTLLIYSNSIAQTTLPGNATNVHLHENEPSSLFMSDAFKQQLASRLGVSTERFQSFWTYCYNRLAQDHFAYFKSSESEQQAIDRYVSYYDLFVKGISIPVSERFYTQKIIQASSRIANGPCVNTDFESGLVGWSGSWGTANPQDPNLNSGFNQGANNALIGRQTIMTGGSDPFVPAIPCVYPGGGSSSVRLGDQLAGATNQNGSERLTQTFLVTSANANFTYHYAVLLNDGGHPANQQPYFKIKMYDEAGNEIVCARLDVNASNASTFNFQSTTIINPNTNVSQTLLYKDWTTVMVPLLAYVGQNVTIEFTTSDCSLSNGSHFAYAYIDAECLPLNFNLTSQTVCSGLNSTIYAPNGLASYNWTGPGIIAGQGTSSITVNQTGNYTCSMTTIGSNCSFTLDTLITLDPHDIRANFTATQACAGTATQFTDMSSPLANAANYQWDFNNDGVTDATTKNPTYTFAVAGTYPVRLSLGWPPCSHDTMINVVVKPNPQKRAGIDASMCPNNSKQIGLPALAGYTYEWTPTTGLSSAQISNPFVTLNNTGASPVINSYVLKTTYQSCVSLDTMRVTVNPLPQVVTGGNKSTCANQSVTLGGNPQPGYVYQWSPANGLSSTSVSNPQLILTNNLAVPLTVKYYLTVSNGICTNTDSVLITVKPNPKPAAGNDVQFCSGTSVNIGTNAIAGQSYSWMPTTGLVNPNASNSALTLNNTGTQPQTYTYQLTSTQDGCSTLDTVLVTVNPFPKSNAGNDAVVCSGNAVQLGVNTIPGYTYNWSPTTGLNNANISNPVASLITSSSVTATYTLTTTAFGCSSRDSVKIVVNPYPVVNAGADQMLCSGSSAQLGVSASNSYNYVWSPATGLNSATISNPTVTINNLGSNTIAKTYTLTVTALGCSSIDSVNVTTKPLPRVEAGNNSVFCSGAQGSLGSSGQAGYTYQWQPTTGLANPFSATTSVTLFNNTTNTVVHTYTLVASSNGCSHADTVLVTVNPLPVADAGAQQLSICSNQHATLGTNETIGYAYKWMPTTGLKDPNVANPSFLVSTTSNTTTNYTYTVEVTGLGGCISKDSIAIEVKPLPYVNAGADVTVCSGNAVQIGNLGQPGYAYSWSPATSLNNPAISNPMVTPAVSNKVENKIYILTSTSNGCSNKDTVIVTVNPVPQINIPITQGQCFAGNAFNFIIDGSYNPMAASYQWTFDPVTASVKNSSVANPQGIHFNTVGKHSVQVIVSQYGCKPDTAAIMVETYPMPKVAFTADNRQGCAPICVTFDDKSTISNGSLVAFEWSIDGSIYKNATPQLTHCFTNPGSYSIASNVISDKGCETADTIHNYVVVYPVPHADFTTSSVQGDDSGPATIVNPIFTIHNNSVGSDSSCVWTVEGMTKAFENCNATWDHQFADTGTYTIGLYVVNTFGCSDTISKDVRVNPDFTFYIPNTFTPNGDGVNDTFYGDGIGVVNCEMWIYDRWGNQLFYGNSLQDKWDGTVQNKGKGNVVQQDTYVYIIKIKNIFGEIKKYTGHVNVVL